MLRNMKLLVLPQLITHNVVNYAVNIHVYKKLSCRREAARCFMSSNILLSHSRSLQMVPFDSLGAVSYSHSTATDVAVSLAALGRPIQRQIMACPRNLSSVRVGKSH